MSVKFRLDRKIGFQNTFYTKCINVKVGNRPVNMHGQYVVITGFNRSLLVDWWSIGRLKKNMANVKILTCSISYPNLLDSINRLKIVSI